MGLRFTEILKKLFGNANYEKIIAFSLIELLIALTTISLVTAAFAPVITKKLSISQINLKTTCVKDKCAKENGELNPDCKICTCSNKCILCLRQEPASDPTYQCPTKYLDRLECTEKQCNRDAAHPNEGFPNCLCCTKEKCNKCIEGYCFSKDGVCEPCEKYIEGCEKCNRQNNNDVICNQCKADLMQPEDKLSCCIKKDNCVKYATANPNLEKQSTTASTCNCSECKAGYYIENGNCKECEPGNSCDGKIKTQCPAGTYQPERGKDSCIDCPAGKYQPDKGKPSCINCLAGHYQPWTKQTSCPDCCPAGQYSSAGASTCTSCLPGSYSSSSCSPSCQACNVANCASYSSGCNCSQCDDGFELSGGKCCEDIIGCTSYDNSCNCNSCESGYTPNSDKSQCCENIPRCNGYNADCDCTSCTNPAHCSSVNTADCSCTACDAGYYMDKNGACQQCPAGCSTCTSAKNCTGCTTTHTLNENGKCCPNINNCTNYKKDCTCDSCTKISNCTDYNSDCKCTECKGGYKPSSNKKSCVQWCTGSSLKYVDGYCITTSNRTDGIDKKDSGYKCSDAFCWGKGVCNYKAASKVCNKIASDRELKCHVPKEEELNDIDNYGSSGVNLTGSPIKGGCSGATKNGYCYPYRIWSTKKSSDNKAYRAMRKSGWTWAHKCSASGVRCICKPKN